MVTYYLSDTDITAATLEELTESAPSVLDEAQGWVVDTERRFNVDVDTVKLFQSFFLVSLSKVEMGKTKYIVGSQTVLEASSLPSHVLTYELDLKENPIFNLDSVKQINFVPALKIVPKTISAVTLIEQSPYLSYKRKTEIILRVCFSVELLDRDIYEISNVNYLVSLKSSFYINLQVPTSFY